MIHLIEMLNLNVILLAAISWLSQSDHDHDNGGVQWKYTSSRIPRFNWDVSKHNPYLYYPPRLLPILGYSDIPLVGGSRLSLLTIIILSHFYWRTQFPSQTPSNMGETISLDDYTTLPVKSGATHSISLCIALSQPPYSQGCVLLWSCIIRSASTSIAVVQGMSSFASSTNLDLGVRQPAWRPFN